jgi:hypothetical protein
MRYKISSFRHGDAILRGDNYVTGYKQVLRAISSITEKELKNKHRSYGKAPLSLSKALNDLLAQKLSKLGWSEQSPIFQEDDYSGRRWTLDFAKAPVSIEVAFNHGEAVAWNLLKPVLASELNHVKKAVQTEIGIIICAMAELKDAGAFDNSVGEYEKFLRYLVPLRNVLSVPMAIIGIRAPRTFRMQVFKKGRKKYSKVVPIRLKRKNKVKRTIPKLLPSRVRNVRLVATPKLRPKLSNKKVRRQTRRR